jgi:hypothetical protein
MVAQPFGIAATNQSPPIDPAEALARRFPGKIRFPG